MSDLAVTLDEYVLPDGWVLAPFADLAVDPKSDIVDGPFGSNLKASEYTDSGVPILRLQNIKRNYFLDKNIKFVSQEKYEQLSRHTYKTGDILITKLGDPLGVACIAPQSMGEGVIVADLVRARLPVDQIDTKYITYLINSPLAIQQFKKNTKGTTRQRVNLKFVRELQLPVAPLEQQKRIVAKIEELFSHIDAGIEALNKAKQLLKQYRQSVLKAAVTGELTKEWREQNKSKLEPASQLLERILSERRQKWEEQQLEQFKAKGKMPKNDKWKERYKEPFELKDKDSIWLTMEVGELFDCLVPNRDKPKTFTGDIPWVTTPMLDEINASVSYEGERLGLSSEEVEKYNARLIPENSVVMTCVGRLGVSVVADQDCVINQQLHCFLPSKYYIPKLLAYFLQEKEKFMDSIATATTIQYLNKTNCNSVPIPVMSMLEQEIVLGEIENRIEGFSRLNDEIDKQLIKAEKNKQSILASAFSGKLT